MTNSVLIKNFLLGFFILNSTSSLISQDFIYPLQIKPSLAGNYAELRKNHFHMGLDFKTEGRENLPVQAVSSGYISRINISPVGYGKSLYVIHPTSGLTSVYAHLNEFSPKIEAWINNLQYQLKRNAIDTNIDENVLPVYQGEIIAKSGNTGSSSGPHLHFEFRDRYSEKTINPLLFYKKIEDTKKPSLSKVIFYELNQKSKFIKSIDVSKIQNQVIELNTDKIGLAVSAYDFMNASSNMVGIYSLKIFENERLIYTFKLDSLDFGWQAHIKSISDYSLGIADVYRGFYGPCGFNITDSGSQNGWIKIINEPKKIKIEVADIRQNLTSIQFYIKASSNVRSFSEEISNPCSEETIFQTENFKISIPPNGLAENYTKDFTIIPSANSSFEIFKFKLYKESTAVLKPYQLKYMGQVNLAWIDKLYLKSSIDKKHKAYIGHWENGILIFPKIKNYGTLTLTYDLSSPDISAKPIKTGNYLKFYIEDKESEIAFYQLSINGQWRKLYYDEKNNLVIYKILSEDKGKKINAVIEVQDRVGNINKKSYEIFL